MSWAIKKINNATGKVTVVNHEGKTLEITFPELYASHEDKKSYMKSCTDKHDNPLKSKISYTSIITILIGLSLIAYGCYHVIWLH